MTPLYIYRFFLGALAGGKCVAFLQLAFSIVPHARKNNGSILFVVGRSGKTIGIQTGQQYLLRSLAMAM